MSTHGDQTTTKQLTLKYLVNHTMNKAIFMYCMRHRAVIFRENFASFVYDLKADLAFSVVSLEKSAVQKVNILAIELVSCLWCLN
jgi:hypothetical protein